MSPMAEPSAHEPLLANGKFEHEYCSKSKQVSLVLVKCLLKSLMWGIFIAWVSLIFFFPTPFARSFFFKLIHVTANTVFGTAGSVFLLFSAPILIIALLAFVYITAFPSDQFEKRKLQPPRFRLWTFPVIVDGPFGVVCATELIGIIIFSAYVLWNIIAYTIQGHEIIQKKFIPAEEKSFLMIKVIGLRLGSIGLFCMAFLFLPVARGSVLLRMIDIPFEHATRYHVWLGHLTMALFTLHGVCYVIAWSLEGHLLKEMGEWQNIGIANLPGVISLIAGILMWITSLHPVRRKYFELFFYTHQLYVVFVVFLVLHVGNAIFTMVAGPVFLFMLDRFLRFCQSRPTVDIISASCRPCGTIELILSKPTNLRYNALSFIFLQVRELSWLQWHPFSVSSSPMEGGHHLSVLIKVLGEWTAKLRDVISKLSEQSQEHQAESITVSVEGPYGHESPYHLMYENLILVAGGIGISPFLAISSDILHRINEGKPCLPKKVLIVWAVKKSKELSLISAVDTQSISASFSDKLQLDVQAYVTQEAEPPLEEGKLYKTSSISSFSVINQRSMPCLVGTGNNVWSGTYVLMSTVGFVAIYGLLEASYIRPYGVSSQWYCRLLFTFSMVAGVMMFGGIIIFLWHWWSKRYVGYDVIDKRKNNLGEYNGAKGSSETKRLNLGSLMTAHYGSRPDFQAIFDSFSDRAGHVDVGVIVCGPPGLQSSVAKECRSQTIRGRWNKPVFHFHSHSFDL